MTGYADAKGNMLNDVKNQAGMGVPIDTKKIEDVSQIYHLLIIVLNALL